MVFGRKQQEWLEFRLTGTTQVTVVRQMPSGRTTAICEASDRYFFSMSMTCDLFQISSRAIDYGS